MPTATTVKLSSKGQLVIPKEIRQQLHWQTGIELILIANESGITLKAQPQKTGRTLADLIGMLKYDGEPVSIEQLCQPVDYSNDWEKSEAE